MYTPILATKLYLPPPRPKVVLRPHLIERLNEGLHRKLTVISAPAGFGKTTLVSEWLAGCGRSTAWLSLDEGDNDPRRFLVYFVAALQTLPITVNAAKIGAGVLHVLQSPQPPQEPSGREAILTTLLNEITTIPDQFILVLDDYHVIDAKPVENALTFLLDHLPPQMHLVIATREDPQLPLARYRVRSQMTELRATDLRFTLSEAAEFLNQMMALKLSPEEIAALESRTEGWIAGLQLAALSMQGQKDANSFIKSFTGSHRFVLDYLVEEVLQRQSESIQTFLLRTSILDRLCGPLCEAVLLDPSTPGQTTLEYLEQANLFIVPLDNERRWYRYHHLFAELLRQRLQQRATASIEDALTRGEREDLDEYHKRASQWYEDNGLELEAFHHAAAANDVERAERLIDGKGIPLHFRGVVTPILDWLASLPMAVLNARPALWWRHASLLLINGQTIGVAEKLQAAETALAAALHGTGSNSAADDKTRNLVGQIAAAKATLALTRYDVETMIVQSRCALEYLYPSSLFTRATANWTLGYAYLLQGDRTAARQSLMEAISLSQRSGAIFTTILATIGLGNVQETENQLHLAAQTYRRVLHLAGDKPQQIIHEAHLGLARVFYEWNDLDAAEKHGRQSLLLAQQYEQVIDRFLLCEIFLARLKLAQGDVAGATAMLAQTDQSAHQQNFVHRIPEIATVQVLALLHQGKLTAAAHLAQMYELPLSQARVHLAEGDASAALAVLEPLRQQVEAKGWQDKRLQVLVLQVLALQANGAKEKAVQLLGDALAIAQPEGFIRLFVDEGPPMVQLLSAAASQGMMPDYVGKLQAAFADEAQARPEGAQAKANLAPAAPAQSLIEPLSQRELEVLQFIAQGFSNQEICKRLFLALSTVKGHNQRIFGKLQVQRRTEAVARARELGLL